ncbi:magnesium transporter [Spirochaeta thermophila DSM 6578]|uniref:Magnesium transporter MgtE n=1 Tax=Winmispira thermophila (strain ATCC 700085 / DSM 6578 / Z-1203) TaxID=869211 RepID=G0GA92_WINT7|nr:magnesium transporter [Spirochaeta thermophila]AEJ60928.1 magnesium transporter [Spirochaeta thermophila DSM 6578]
MEREHVSRDVVLEWVRQRLWHKVKQELVSWHPSDIAEFLGSLEEEEASTDALILFLMLPPELKGDVFSEFDTELQRQILERITSDQVKEILSELSHDDRIELLENLPGNLTRRVLNLLSPDDRSITLELLGYPEDSVGRLMTPDYVSLKPHWTIEKALDHIRRYGKDAEIINMLYVIDEEGHLMDDILLRKVILAPPDATVESIMDWHYVAINAYADQEEAVRLIRKYDLNALPVVDDDNILLGIVTVDDIIDVLDEETTEDVHKESAVVPLETSYSQASPFLLYTKRVVWLFFLGISGFLSSGVISRFQGVLSSFISLSLFIPMLMGTGGNTSSQAATLVIRALAVGELTPRRWFLVVRKELLVGLLLGGSLGLVLATIGYLWTGDTGIALTVGLSIVGIVLWANLIGSTLPLLCTWVGIDPALISSPLLSTILDVTGLLIYFTVTTLVLL